MIATVPYNIVNMTRSLKSIYGSKEIEVTLITEATVPSLTDVHITVKELEGPHMTRAEVVAHVRNRCLEEAMPLNRGMIYEFIERGPTPEERLRLYFRVERLSNLHDGAIGKISVTTGRVTSRTQFYVTAEQPLVIHGYAQTVQERTRNQMRVQFANVGALGIGGLDSIFSDILKQLLAPRLLSPEFVRLLKFNASKGFILEGPPGTGKTLIVRKLGMLLNAHVKILRGPEILSQYVGEAA